MEEESFLGERFKAALIYALDLHARQRRKGSGVPYVSHLLGVTDLTLQMGGDEDEAIAALLHDAVEDQGGIPTLDEIRNRFGERVAEIVKGCSDSFETPKSAWRRRKEAYLEHLQSASASVLRVSLADKIHNARDIKVSYCWVGDAVWQRFKGGKAGTLWYYHRLVEEFRRLQPGVWTEELAHVVADLDECSGKD